MLGTSILWSDRTWDTGRPLPPQDWRELCLATVTTHDLPPTAGYLSGDHVALRDRLGLLTRSLEEELAVHPGPRTGCGYCASGGCSARTTTTWSGSSPPCIGTSRTRGRSWSGCRSPTR